MNEHEVKGLHLSKDPDAPGKHHDLGNYPPDVPARSRSEAEKLAKARGPEWTTVTYVTPWPPRHVPVLRVRVAKHLDNGAIQL